MSAEQDGLPPGAPHSTLTTIAFTDRARNVLQRADA